MCVIFYGSGKHAPPEIRAAAVAAYRRDLVCRYSIAFMCMSPGPERLAILQEQWSECNGHWSESTFYKQLKQETRLRRKGCHRWLTHAELKLKYGDCDVAQSIVDQKELEDPEATGEQVRPHPDCAKVPCPLVCI